MSCISLNPATADAWCQLNCIGNDGNEHPEVVCPEELCKCGEDAVAQRAQEHDQEVAAAMDPNPNPEVKPNPNPNPNPSPHPNQVARWKEAEARVRGADIGSAYPDGLPPAEEVREP